MIARNTNTECVDHDKIYLDIYAHDKYLHTVAENLSKVSLSGGKFHILALLVIGGTTYIIQNYL